MALDTITLPQIPDGTLTETPVNGETHRTIHNTMHTTLPIVVDKLGHHTGSTPTPARGQALIGNGTGTSTWDTLARKNVLINGDFQVWQRGTSGPTTADNAYGPDRWRCLTETTSTGFVVSQESSDLPTGGARRACKFAIGASNNIKGGIFTPLEGQDIWHMRGQSVSLQFKMKVSDARIGDVRAAIVQWTGTEDAVSADPINVWGAAATVPTYTGSWANANTPANLSPTTSWATYRIENVTISSSATNLAVFIWIDDKTTTAGDYMLVTDVQLELGSVCTEVERRHTAEERMLCKRYFQRFGGTTNAAISNGGYCTGTTQALIPLRFEQAMRAAPTVTYPTAGNLSISGTTSAALTSVSSSNISPEAVIIITGYTTGPAAGQAVYLYATNSSGIIDAEKEL